MSNKDVKTSERRAFPIYISPFNREYSQYNDHLVAFNRKVQEGVTNDLSAIFEDFPSKISIATTGSDSRLEKGPASPIELVLFTSANLMIPEAIERLNYYFSSRKGLSFFSDSLEVKNLLRDKMYQSVLHEGEREITLFSPNRMLDARVLFAEDGTFPLALEKLVDEIVSPEGKSVLKRIKSRVRDHVAVTDTGVQEYKGLELQHFDLEEGLSFYDPAKNLWSFKQGPLRAVQYAIVRDTIRRIRQTGVAKDVLSLPKNTIEKLSRIEVEGYSPLSHTEMDELTDSYKYFLHLYHQSQANYLIDSQKELSFDPSEVKLRKEAITRICSKQILSDS